MLKGAAREPGAITGSGASLLFRIFFPSVLITSGSCACASGAGADSTCLAGTKLGVASGAAHTDW